VLRPAIGLPHSGACNLLVARFLETDCDSLLFIDDDMVFDHTSLAQLRAEDGGFAVLSALYTTRRPPFTPIILMEDPSTKTGTVRLAIPPGGGLLKVDVVGLGFTLIRRDVLAPNCFDWINGLGEDGAFCRRVRAMGREVGVNADVNIGHRATFTIRWNENAVATEGAKA